ncbi:CFAB factor, partial [Amia calva]|nr:CFAB factor [Amia calva]
VVTCPDPSVLQQGSVTPSQPQYFIHNETRYQCYESYKLRGSASRTCQSNGKWSGDTPICDSLVSADDCPDPGVPPGTRRTGNRFGIDDKVSYRCDRGLILVGSSERVCLENREWSGAEPACYYKHTYDSPEDVAQAFSSSLGNLLEVSGSEAPEADGKRFGRKIKLQRGGKLNIYVALDCSSSVGIEDFKKSKNCIEKLIEKIGNFEVSPRYDVLTFATTIKEIVNINDEDDDPAIVMDKIANFNYEDHGDQTGTNIAGAFHNIHGKMNFLSASKPEKFRETRHVIILFTDGRANMGGSAELEVKQIKQLIRGHMGDSWEEYLDIYVFGVGDEIEENEINKMVTHKHAEKHFFKMADIKTLEQTFDDIIDESDSVGLCGLYRSYDNPLDTKKSKRQMYPWLVTIKITVGIESCKGSLVSPCFVLTAAHCFRTGDKAGDVKVIIDDNEVESGASEKQIIGIITHPQFNPGLKADQGIPEFYDYDIALIELQEDVKISRQARPICIPCTKSTSRALGLFGEVTCQQHKEALYMQTLELASFMSEVKNEVEKKNVRIKLRGQRTICIRDALKAPGVTTSEPTEIVTDRFLCTGGTQPEKDDITCKGMKSSMTSPHHMAKCHHAVNQLLFSLAAAVIVVGRFKTHTVQDNSCNKYCLHLHYTRHPVSQC